MTMYIVYFNLICLFISTITCNQVTDQIDFERDCDTQMIVTDYTVVEVFASPQAGVIPDSASCQAKFVGKPEDRKLRIYVQEFFLGPGACGHKMKIYDGDPYQNDPKWELGCNTPVATYTSSSNEIILSFVKPTIDTSQLYKFNIKITTDRADSMTGDPGGSSGGGLTSGAIAGIAVGCVVGAVIIIAICIYALWKFMRQAEEKKRYGHSEPPPAISVISAPPLSNCGIPPGSSRRSFRSHVAFSDISKKSEKDSSSSDGVSKSRSTKSYDNHGFSNDGTSVSSSHNKSDFKDADIKSSKNDRNVDKDEFGKNGNIRGSYRKDKDISYPDVVDSARKSEEKKRPRDDDNERFLSRDARSRSNSVKRSDRDREKYKDDGRLRERSTQRHKSRDDEYDRDDWKDKRYDKFHNDKREDQKPERRHKTESVFTDDSSATSLSARDKDRRDRRSKETDRHCSRRHRAELIDDRRYCDDRYEGRGYQGSRYDERKSRDRKYSERSINQRQYYQDSQRRHYPNSDDWNRDLGRSRREEPTRQRSHSTSRMKSNREKYFDHDRNKEDRGNPHRCYDDDHEMGLRRRESSRSQSGRHRSRSSYR